MSDAHAHAYEAVKQSILTSHDIISIPFLRGIYLKQFSKVSAGNRGALTYWLVYRGDMSTSGAINRVYQLAREDYLRDAGLELRRIIQQAFKDSTVHDIPDPWLPDELHTFLNYIFDGQNNNKNMKTYHLILSIGQDICRAVTSGQCRLPKHILLCTTIRHLYRSRQLTNILSRLGHCKSYAFGLELDTALVSYT